METNKKHLFLVAVVIGFVLGAWNIIVLYNNYAIISSCDEIKILYILRIGPRESLMKYTSCDVNIEVFYNNTTICSSSSKSSRDDLAINYCENMDQYRGKVVTIIADFYSLNNEKIGRDEKELMVL